MTLIPSLARLALHWLPSVTGEYIRVLIVVSRADCFQWRNHGVLQRQLVQYVIPFGVMVRN